MQDDFGKELPHPLLEDMRNEIAALKKGLAENTEVTQRIESGTAQLMEILESLRGAFKVLGWIGSLAKPVSAIIGLGTAIWLAYRASSPSSSQIIPPK